MAFSSSTESWNLTNSESYVIPYRGGGDAEGKKLWRPKAADSVLSLRLGNWRIDRILHFYHVFMHFASYKDKSLLSEFFSRKVEQ